VTVKSAPESHFGVTFWEIHIFIRVKWEMYVSDPKKAFREKGLTVVPLVAYTLTDKKTHARVIEYFEK